MICNLWSWHRNASLYKAENEILTRLTGATIGEEVSKIILLKKVLHHSLLFLCILNFQFSPQKYVCFQ